MRQLGQCVLDAKAAEMPHFRYRPLAVDPDNAKRALYDIDLSIIEDPLLERLLTETLDTTFNASSRSMRRANVADTEIALWNSLAGYLD